MRLIKIGQDEEAVSVWEELNGTGIEAPEDTCRQKQYEVQAVLSPRVASSSIMKTRDGRMFARRAALQHGATKATWRQRGENQARKLTNEEARERLNSIETGIRGQREVNVEALQQSVGAAIDLGRSDGTHIAKRSHMAYWKAFKEETGMDTSTFYIPTWGSQRGEFTARQRENEILACFAAYVVHRPRRIGKGRNTGAYARLVVASIRSCFAEEVGRQPGTNARHFSSTVLGPLFKGLEKFSPSPQQYRLPILQQHLRLIRKHLDVEGSHEDCTLWALWLTQWQGVLRSGDLIKSGGHARSNWNPETCTHRGRVTTDVIVEEGALQGRIRVSLELKPTKTDQAGEKGFIKTLIVDDDADSLSAGYAILQMLASDKVGGDQTSIPLFRDKRSGEEISYELSKRRLKEVLIAAGLRYLATGCHCLRIGGATAYANYPNGGELVAGYMGLWVSGARFRYMHGCNGLLERAGLSVGKERGDTLSSRPGPVSSYAGRAA